MAEETFEEKLRAIFAEDALPPLVQFDDQLDAEPAHSSPAIDIESKPAPVSKAVVRVAALGGRAVEVDEARFQRLAADAGVVVQGDLEPAGFGALIQRAVESRSPLLADVLHIRDLAARMYRVTSGGRSWWSFPRPALPEVTIKQDAGTQPAPTQEIHP